MNARMTARVLKGVVVGLAVAALAVPAAAAPPVGKGPPEGKGPSGEASNNLSVPALFVGDEDPYSLVCATTPVPPTGTPLPYYAEDDDGNVLVDGYFYVQGTHTWRASCIENVDPTANVYVTAEWGDNLAGDAKLKAGKPIRVEVGLYEEDAEARNLTGYTVIKLQPNLLDRESDYGTQASGDSGTGFEPVAVTPFEVVVDPDTEPPTTRAETRVWDYLASMAIYDKADLEGDYPQADAEPVAEEENASAEINATGRVVYGYNLRVTVEGSYRIFYTFPTVTITGTDGDGSDAHRAWIDIDVVPGGGGGGKKN